LSFAASIGGSAPASQKITVTSTGGVVQFNAGTTSTPGGWLSADTTSAATPKEVNISVNPQGLAAGTYNGSVSITAPGVLANPIVVNVTLTVSAVVPQLAEITNTASNRSGPIAAGELVTLRGSSLGPPAPPNNGLFSLNAQGGIDATLFGVRVLFDGTPGTPLYVSATQINVIVPWELAGRTGNVSVVVEYNGAQSAVLVVALASAAPAIYTVDNTGSGQAVATNQDGTRNGPPGAGTAPLPQNSVLIVYANGGGVTSPQGTTGSLSPTNQLLRISGPVSATIGGQEAAIDFIGAAPGLVTGVVQINLRPKPGVSGNNLSITVTINGIASPPGPTVAVQ
jgi:uncharacterized protein (TIGR03437 family)